LKRGREFSSADKTGGAPVAMINESLARQFWPEYPNGVDPVGRRLLIGASPLAWQIVGIVEDTHHASLDIDMQRGVYRPFAQASSPSVMFAVRTERDPMQFAGAVRSQVLAIDADQPISAVRAMEDIVDASQGQRRLVMTLLGLFAAIAVLLTLIGLYGVIAYSVVQRRREVGLRIAVGANSGDILRMLAGHGMRLTFIGVAIGLAGAYGVTRVLSSLLFRISATDPLTFVGIALLFVAVAFVATYIPARRAIRLDPMTVLRCE
jgi:predicted permease